MLNRYKLVIIATIIAVYFTSLVYLLPNYKMLWFSLEFILLPVVYIIGYEILMERQKKKYEEVKNKINKKLNEAVIRYIEAKKKD